MKIIPALMLALAASPVFAQQPLTTQGACGELSSYVVQRTSFSKITVREALERITKGTPYRLLVSSSLDTVLVTASNVSGRLDGVMTDLIGQISQHHHVSWNADKCAITVDSQGPKKAINAWEVRTGASLRATLQEWTRRAGWQLAWELKDDFMLGANARFEGEMSQAVEALLAAVGASREVKVEMYEGNRVMRVVAKSRGGN